MKYLILVPDDRRILHISGTLDYQSNGNYLINDGTIAVPPSICTLVEVDAVPEVIEPEKWCYIDGEFVINSNWREPDEPGSTSADVDELLNIIKGVAE